MGENGLELLRKEHAPAAYAAALMELAARAVEFRARAASLCYAGNVSERVASWFNPTSSENMMRRIADQIYSLMGS